MDLTDWRNRIDVIDAELVQLLNKRLHCVIEIGKLKRLEHLEVYDPEREMEVLHNVVSHNVGPLENDALLRIFERIIDESRRLERSIMQD